MLCRLLPLRAHNPLKNGVVGILDREGGVHDPLDGFYVHRVWKVDQGLEHGHHVVNMIVVLEEDMGGVSGCEDAMSQNRNGVERRPGECRGHTIHGVALPVDNRTIDGVEEHVGERGHDPGKFLLVPIRDHLYHRSNLGGVPREKVVDASRGGAPAAHEKNLEPTTYAVVKKAQRVE